MSKKKIVNRKLIYRFFCDFIRKFIFANIFFLVCAAVESILENLVPVFTQKLVDDVLIKKQSGTFVRIIVIMFVIYTVNTLIGYIVGVECNKISEKIVRNIRSRVFEHIIRLKMSYHDRTSVGENISRIENDIGMLQSLFESAFTDVVINLFDFVCITFMMLRISVTLTFISLFLIVFYILIANKLMILVKKISREMLGINSDVVSKMTEALNKIITVKLFTMEKTVLRNFFNLQDKLMNKKIQLAKMQIMNMEIAYFIFKGAEVLVWCLGGWFVLHNRMTLGALTAFIVYQKNYLSPIRSISELTGQISSASAALERIYEILDRTPETLGQLEFKGLKKNLIIKNLCFKYENAEKENLKNLSLKINHGEVVAVVGQNGSGKSTLAKLLVRLYKEQEGEVLIDDVNLNQYTLESIRRHITILPQQVNLFNMSLTDNLMLEDNKDNMLDTMEEWISMKEIINKLPDGYDSIIYEKESNLSGGEKQKIGIFRSALRIGRSDILILDEPSSYLDTRQREIVSDMLHHIDCAVKIIITHSYTELLRADQIIVLHQGEAVGVGTHDELLESCIWYRKLFKQKNQAGGEKDV